MKKKKINRTLFIIPILLFIFFSGCSRHARHKVLTFFFTGVPSLEQQEAEKYELQQQTMDAPEPEEFILYSHNFYAKRQCEKCHEGAVSFSAPGQKKEAVSTFKLGRDMPGPLILPPDELCLCCHIDKSTARAAADDLWLHTPAATGACLDCHSAHQSRNQFILLNKALELCDECHSDGEEFRNTEVHQKSGECMSCHNPHLGANSYILIEDLKEEKQQVDP